MKKFQSLAFGGPQVFDCWSKFLFEGRFWFLMRRYSPVDLAGNVNMIEKLVLGGTGTGDTFVAPYNYKDPISSKVYQNRPRLELCPEPGKGRSLQRSPKSPIAGFYGNITLQRISVMSEKDIYNFI